MMDNTVSEGDPVAFWNICRIRKTRQETTAGPKPDSPGPIRAEPDRAGHGPAPAGPEGGAAEPAATLELAGRRTAKAVVPVIGKSVLELAEANGIDFASHCRRGTCARCRCRVESGGEFLNEPNAAETERLTDDEIARGYRLGCQARVAGIGPVRIRHAPYF